MLPLKISTFVNASTFVTTKLKSESGCILYTPVTKAKNEEIELMIANRNKVLLQTWANTQI